MEEILQAIKRSAIRIKQAIQNEDTGYTDNVNQTGDIQLKLDVQSDLIIEEELTKVSSIKELVSEEKEEIKKLNNNGKYLVGYDPLDGSSLIDVNLSVGSIFGIYENGYNGSDLSVSVYVVYGPRVELVIASKASDEVGMYRLLNNEFEFIKNIRLNEKGKLNAPGSTQSCWSTYHKQMIDELFQDGYRLRYSGGMVPDLHQILLKGGGLFSYPGTIDRPEGKLRKVFEVFPFALIYEKAGGASIDGINRVLDSTTTHIHGTMPCFFGSNYEIEYVKKTYTKNAK
ncbi:MAG: Fructose-1,6-bisphosphatase, type I (EC [uncultured Campylobacterales bacterium]|uniref:Fructose-1,6-bisphosphatase class 1 n=1 Tax=uncultured Campylobacterales bacterium TaxID=352960 RepID=A0A6S6S0G4_9BACT|nr:MAG: Fructose-1,6-bisphosphatase, type I (EC [uncultured Campylobacterales bacterium]